MLFTSVTKVRRHEMPDEFLVWCYTSIALTVFELDLYIVCPFGFVRSTALAGKFALGLVSSHGTQKRFVRNQS